MAIRAKIIGTGAYVPDEILTNAQLPDALGTSDEWIQKRTGIAQRHIAAKDQSNADMAIRASKLAMQQADIDPDTVDLVVMATTTPDHIFPANACAVQHGLGITNGCAFDVQSVCSGFIYALNVASNMIALGQARCAIVVGSEIYSRILDWSDRSTCVLFGDGAGAVVLSANNNPDNNSGIIDTHLGSDGMHYKSLYVDGGPASGTSGFVRMAGQDVFRHAVMRMAQGVTKLLDAHNIEAQALDWVIPHQANSRIIYSVADKLHMPHDKFIVTVANHANTSAATIPMAMDNAVRKNAFKRGDLMALTAMGGGFSWGATLLRW